MSSALSLCNSRSRFRGRGVWHCQLAENRFWNISLFTVIHDSNWVMELIQLILKWR